jgi:hypothetical protein
MKLVEFMTKLDFLKMFKMVKEDVESKEYLEKARRIPTAFTRIRKMPFCDIINFIISSKARSVQTELDLFFKQKGGKPMSRQAFSKARENIDPRAIMYLNRKALDKFEKEDLEVLTYKGYRLIGVDGTIIDLPNTPALREAYGYSSNGTGKDYAKALSVMAFDVLNKLILEAGLDRYDDGEKTLIMPVVDSLEASGYMNCLLLLDRGYPSFDLFDKLESKGMKYVIRVSSNSLAEINAISVGEKALKIERRNRAVHLRVVNISLKGGGVEKLVTNLPDDFNSEELKELYSKRWGSETNFDRLKNKMLLEVFTGESETAVLQDFYAAILVTNLTRFAEREQEDILSKGKTRRERKNEYKPNASKLIADIKENWVKMIYTKNPRRVFNQIMLNYRVRRYAVYSLQDRSFPRVIREKTHRKSPM